MAIAIGNTAISDVAVGNTAATALALGNVVVWQKTQPVVQSWKFSDSDLPITVQLSESDTVELGNNDLTFEYGDDGEFQSWVDVYSNYGKLGHFSGDYGATSLVYSGDNDVVWYYSDGVWPTEGEAPSVVMS